MTSEAGRELARRSHEVQRQRLGDKYHQDMARRSRERWEQAGSRERASALRKRAMQEQKRDKRGRFAPRGKKVDGQREQSARERKPLGLVT
jgi:hypothetical protein